MRPSERRRRALLSGAVPIVAALLVKQLADEERGNCELLRHSYDALRERDAFQDAVWLSLDLAAKDEQATRERLSTASRDQKCAREETLRQIAPAREAVETLLHHSRSVTDLEWPHVKHDVETAVDNLYGLLRAVR